ncbi:hypothetical protein RRF57_005958 [Xylaria bambusicola]|uniref:Uncharacterized protein n=1 Tax=Xylaria bambusicola TaxID=326684 RepID=A0AAN7UYQ6_9PEZI
MSHTSSAFEYSAALMKLRRLASHITQRSRKVINSVTISIHRGGRVASLRCEESAVDANNKIVDNDWAARVP